MKGVFDIHMWLLVVIAEAYVDVYDCSISSMQYMFHFWCHVYCATIGVVLRVGVDDDVGGFVCATGYFMSRIVWVRCCVLIFLVRSIAYICFWLSCWDIVWCWCFVGLYWCFELIKERSSCCLMQGSSFEHCEMWTYWSVDRISLVKKW